MGNIFDESYRFPEIKKPTKPIKLDRPPRGLEMKFGESEASHQWAVRQHNFLAEMFKFMPSYEQSSYLYDQDSLEEDFYQYDENPEDGVDFGQVKRAVVKNRLVGYATGKDYAESIDYRDGFSDFSHIKNGSSEVLAGESFGGLSPTLFQKIKNKFQSDDRNFYQVIMDHDTTSLSAMTHLDAYLLMGALYESRERVYLAMTELFGDANETDDQVRIQQISQWLEDEGEGLTDDSKQVF
ncbi:MAG: hypothetical protein KDC92_17785, partial [Bacteroidetes bacterium]|nr:hypothetical protein [Bacteroidota bacterium]